MSLGYRWFVSHKYPPLALVRRAYLPGECAALALGVPVASDERVDEPSDARLVPCYHDLMADRGQTAIASAVEKELTKTLVPVDRPLDHARVVAAAMRGGKLDVAIAPGGPESGELRYQLSRDGKVGALISPSLSVPQLGRWKAGHLYVDHVELPPGRWDVELQLVDNHKPTAVAPLGTFTR